MISEILSCNCWGYFLLFLKYVLIWPIVYSSYHVHVFLQTSFLLKLDVLFQKLRFEKDVGSDFVKVR